MSEVTTWRKTLSWIEPEGDDESLTYWQNYSEGPQLKLLSMAAYRFNQLIRWYEEEGGPISNVQEIWKIVQSYFQQYHEIDAGIIEAMIMQSAHSPE